MRNLLLIFPVLLMSCEQSHINFTVKNNSEVKYDSVIVNGLGTLKFTDLHPKSKMSGYIDWSESKADTDGAYQIKLYQDGNIQSQLFGYYSNGAPLSDNFEITIETNSILVKDIIAK